MSIPTLLYMASYLCFSLALIGFMQLIAPFRFPTRSAAAPRGTRGGGSADRGNRPAAGRPRSGRPHMTAPCVRAARDTHRQRQGTRR